MIWIIARYIFYGYEEYNIYDTYVIANWTNYKIDSVHDTVKAILVYAIFSLTSSYVASLKMFIKLSDYL